MALAVLLLAPAAQAAQRYAAPTGTGTECTPGNPCSLKDALAGAKASDEVIVTGGTYMPLTPVTLSSEATGAYVHGDFSGPRPTIIGTVSDYTLRIVAPKSRVSYLEVTTTALNSAALNCASDTVAERMRVSARGAQSFGSQVTGSCVFRDSLAQSEGQESSAVHSRSLAASRSRGSPLAGCGAPS